MNTFLYFCSKTTHLKVWYNISEFRATNPVVTIGSFDGVHLGHIEVINQLKQIAQTVNGESVIFTFFPHPLRVLAPNKEFVLLTTIEEKIDLFSKAGVDHLVVYEFTKDFASLSYSDFVKSILLDQLHTHTILVGYDNKIGKDREGNYLQLVKLSKQWGFNVKQQKKVTLDDSELSSTQIREHLTAGKLLEAAKLLGYSYIISGTVVHGHQLGNKLGFPTANILPPENKFIPGIGVYAITVEHRGKTYLGMMNIGIRPTLDDDTKKPVIEAHLFDFDQNLYGEFIKISIIRKLRNEYKFDSIDALRSQLKKDKAFALETLHNEFGI